MRGVVQTGDFRPSLLKCVLRCTFIMIHKYLCFLLAHELVFSSVARQSRYLAPTLSTQEQLRNSRSRCRSFNCMSRYDTMLFENSSNTEVTVNSLTMDQIIRRIHCTRCAMSACVTLVFGSWRDIVQSITSSALASFLFETSQCSATNRLFRSHRPSVTSWRVTQSATAHATKGQLERHLAMWRACTIIDDDHVEMC